MSLSKRLLLWLAVLSLSATSATFFVVLPHINHNDRAQLDALISGSAHRPFQYRILVPGLAALLGTIIPEPTGLIQSALDSILTQFGGASGPSIGILLIQVISMLITVIYTARLGQALGLGRHAITTAASLPFIVVIFFTIILRYAYIYDLPQMALFPVALYAILKERRAVYLALLAAATINKETALILIIVSAWWLLRLDPTFQKWLFVACQIAVYGLLRLALILAFKDNPGGLVEWHIWEHFQYDGLYYHNILIIISAVLILRHWQSKPLFLRGTLLIGLTVLLPLFLVWGYPTEIRVFMEIVPVWLLLMQ